MSLQLQAAKQKLPALAGGPQAARAGSLGAHVLRSPIDGTVVERGFAPGQFIDSQLVAFKVANLDCLWIELHVFERHLHRIQLGDQTRIQPLSAAGAKAIEGVVAKVGTNIDPETHSAKVRIEIDSRNRRLRAGQAVKATIQASAAKKASALLVPTQAITYVDGHPQLFVAMGSALVCVARARLVASEDETETSREWPRPDDIVTSGAAALKSELFR